MSSAEARHPDRLPNHKPNRRERPRARTAAAQERSFAASITGSTQSAADETIHHDEVMTLTAQDGETFVLALLDPPEPNERLRAAARRHRELLGA